MFIYFAIIDGKEIHFLNTAFLLIMNPIKDWQYPFLELVNSLHSEGQKWKMSNCSKLQRIHAFKWSKCYQQKMQKLQNSTHINQLSQTSITSKI